MKNRESGFLSEDYINHTSEVFDYIIELHDYLWNFIRIAKPEASGDLKDYLDDSLTNLKYKNKEIN